LAVLADHRHGHDPALRVRRRGHRRPGLAVGHAARRHRARRGPADRRPDQPVQPVPGRLPRLPGRAGAPAPGPHQQEGAVMSVVVVLALFPYLVYSGTTSLMVQGFIVVILASMWNLMAGYAGLVSVGQQAFIGLGAYFVLILAQHSLSPFGGLPVAAIGCGVAAVPMWWLISRLRSGYFAIATWVLATAIMLFIERFPSIGGGTGMSLPGLSGYDPTLLVADTYWIGLAVTVLSLVTVYVMLRGRIGLVLTAIRDDEVAARSSGARVGLARMLVYVVAAVGCGAAGALLAISQLIVQPGAVFTVQWTAKMAFAVIIGGLGTIEGPIIGA